MIQMMRWKINNKINKKKSEKIDRKHLYYINSIRFDCSFRSNHFILMLTQYQLFDSSQPEPATQAMWCAVYLENLFIEQSALNADCISMSFSFCSRNRKGKWKLLKVTEETNFINKRKTKNTRNKFVWFHSMTNFGFNINWNSSSVTHLYNALNQLSRFHKILLLLTLFWHMRRKYIFHSKISNLISICNKTPILASDTQNFPVD